jgi:hypothetical protein
MNVELQTFILSKVGFKWNICIPCINFKWFLQQWFQNCSDKILKVSNSVSPNSFGWLSWQLQIHKYRSTYLKIEQNWIQIKGVYPLYQLQMISCNNDIRITPIKPRKWATQLVLTVQLSSKNWPIFCMFTHKAFLINPYQGFTTLPSITRC